jgi:hypothetical protein
MAPRWFGLLMMLFSIVPASLVSAAWDTSGLLTTTFSQQTLQGLIAGAISTGWITTAVWGGYFSNQFRYESAEGVRRIGLFVAIVLERKCAHVRPATLPAQPDSNAARRSRFFCDGWHASRRNANDAQLVQPVFCLCNYQNFFVRL